MNTVFKSALFICLLILIHCSNLIGQRIAMEGPPSAQVNYEQLKKIDTVVEEYIKKDWLKGAVSIIVKDGQVIQYKAYGYADAETKRPMSRDAIFRIMSQTKAITSVGIMILFEQGKLLLDEPISDFITEFRHPVVLDQYQASDTTYTTLPANREITFRDLLTHSSGLDYADIGSPKGNAIYAKAGIPSGLGIKNANLLDKMKSLARLPLLFQPGEKWQYGLNSDLLGCLIEVISGSTLEDFLHHYIFEPLGMKDTYFNLPLSKANRLPSVYTEDSLHHIIKWSHSFRHIDPDYPIMEKHYFSGGAGLSATTLDYAIFMQMLLNGGLYNGHRILSPRSVALMTSPEIKLPHSEEGFGLGFQITSAASAARNPRNEGSFSWGGYFGTTYWADPKEHMVCLFMTQQSPNSHGELSQKFENLVYASLLK